MQLALLLFAFFAGMLQPAANPLNQETLKNYIEKGTSFDFVLIDVRRVDEVSKAIGNDTCKPYNLVWPDQFKELSTKISKDMTVIVYCKSGGRAGAAADYLAASGYTRVYNAGGFQTWTGPTVAPSELKPVSLLPEPSCKAR